MALKFKPFVSQSPKSPSFSLPPMASLRSPKFFMASTLRSGTKIPKQKTVPTLVSSTLFQERATFISHGNTARHSKEHGDMTLAQICGTIASDEKRHETAYTKIVEKLFEIDPDGTVVAFAEMMRKNISMPAHLIFDHFSAVAQRLGVYTTKDYADILEFLVARVKVQIMFVG